MAALTLGEQVLRSENAALENSLEAAYKLVLTKQ